VRAPAVARKKPGAAQGEVVHEVIPDVSKNSRNTITGTIKVTVQVEVDPSGKVTSAKLKNAGPSKYFAGLALKAAQRWELSPQPTASTWLIQFRFKRSGTQASAERANR
jgi:TonB family protein